MTVRNGLVFALVLISLVLASPGHSTAVPEGRPPEVAARQPDRPLIGLALGGGGARGVAHLGVIEELERLGVPIDMIAGTSMGAIVGGLYASGRPSDEMRELILDLDWRTMLQGRLARDQRSLRSKSNDGLFPFDMAFSFSEGRFLAPSAMLNSLELDFQLASLLLNVSDIHDFDELEIPFRAMAADTISGRLIALRKGSLATALRASMSLPGIFPPVAIDDMLLVDGGVLDNLPVDVVREMGADIVIAVDVGSPPPGGQGLETFIGVLGQAMDLRYQNHTARQRQNADVLILPDLGEAGRFDFEDSKALIEAGSAAVREMSQALAPFLNNRDSEPPRSSARRKTSEDSSELPSDQGKIQAVYFDGLERIDERLLRARTRAEPGQTLDLALLHQDLGRIQQVDGVASVRLELERLSSTSQPGTPPPSRAMWNIRYLIREIPGGGLLVRTGLSLDDDFNGDTDLGFRASVSSINLGPRNAEWRIDLEGGRHRFLRTEFYQPLDFTGRWFVSSALFHRFSIADVFIDGNKIAEYDALNNEAGIAFGRVFGNAAEFRIGLSRGNVKAEIDVGDPTLPRFEVDTGGVSARFLVDRLDSGTLPLRGFSIDSSYYNSDPSLGADDDYSTLQAHLFGGWTKGDHSVHVQSSIAETVDGDLPAYADFLIGGPLSLSGFAEGELRVDSYASTRIGYLYRLFDLPIPFGNGVHVGAWLDAVRFRNRLGESPGDETVMGGSLVLAVDSRIGPLYFTYGISEGTEGRVGLRVGRSF